MKATIPIKASGSSALVHPRRQMHLPKAQRRIPLRPIDDERLRTRMWTWQLLAQSIVDLCSLGTFEIVGSASFCRLSGKLSTLHVMR